ncbi:MAG: sugar phosphate isomerase/epimerase family protein [Bryobacteraceae bacterium]
MISRRAVLSLAASAAFAKRAPWTLGANTAIDGYDLFRAIETIRELGFRAIEIHPMGVPAATPGRFPGFLFDRLSAADKSRIRRALAPFRHVTTHLPYTGWNWMSGDAAEREASIRAVETAMDATAYFGARLAVLHPQPLPAGRENELRAAYLERFRTWGDRARKLGFRLALETGYPRSIAAYTALIRDIGHPAIGSTIDVGHQSRYAELTARVKPEERSTPAGIRAYNDTTIAIAEQLGAKLFHLHVHDIDPATWQEHKPLVHGFVDYPRLFATLRKIGYKGILMLEIGGPASELPGWLRQAKQKLEEMS